MNVGFKNKGVAAPTQGFVWLFFYQDVTRVDNQDVDLIEQLWGEKTDVVFKCLEAALSR